MALGIQVKANTPALSRPIDRALNRKSDQIRTAGTFGLDHGRPESRNLEMVPLSPMETGWPHTHVACRVERDRQLLRRGEVIGHTHQVSHYVGSFHADAREPSSYSIAHWEKLSQPYKLA